MPTGIYKRDEKTIERLRNMNKGRVFSEEYRKNLSKSLKGRTSPMKGKKLSEEHKKKISEAHKGKPKEWLRGRKQTEEHKRKVNLKKIGRKNSEETKDKIRRTKIEYYKNNPKEILRLKNLRKGKKMKLNERIKKSLLSPKGENHWNWKGGISKINESIRKTFEYKLWRKAVFERDNYTCIWCGTKSGKGKKVIIHADHIKPFALFPELRFAIDNGRTLCNDCHKTTDTYGGKIKNKK